MKGPVLLLVLLVGAGDAAADIFKINDTSAGTPLQKAVEEDSAGTYYRAFGDDDLTSYFKGPFDYGTNTVKRKISRRVDLNATISRQIPKVLTGVDVDAAMRQINLSPLMLWQYSSPAAADLFKHFHTVSQLKMGMLYDDLRGVEQGLEGSLDLLRDQSELACLEEKLARGSFNKDVVDLMISCRDTGASPGAVFSYLSSGGTGVRVYDRLFNRLHLRDHKADILDILPDWAIRPDGYRLLGPAKRIGEVFAEFRWNMMEGLDAVLKRYRRDKKVDAGDLAAFSRPGIPFTDQSVRNLASLTEDQAWIVMAHLSTELAFHETMDRYAMAEEWLARLLTHPLVEEAYKHIIRKGQEFLREEKASLDAKHRQLRQHAAVMGSLKDAAQEEWKDSIREGSRSSHRRKYEEIGTWTK